MRTKDENKRIAIREATVAEVVAGGLAGASIARIAQRAKLSQGTIYLYYPTKESLIRQVYVEIKQDMRNTLMDCLVASATSAENIREVWYALFNYAMEYPNYFAFAEYITAANLFDQVKEPALVEIEREMKSIITTAIDDGTLKSAPYESLQAVLVAPISQLSRRVNIRQSRLSETVRDSTFDLIWQGIANS